MNPRDWVNLKNIYKFLEFFYDCTKANKSFFDSINFILFAMDCLLSHLEETVNETYINNLFIQGKANAVERKIKLYYYKINDSPVYITAMMLNPT